MFKRERPIVKNMIAEHDGKGLAIERRGSKNQKLTKLTNKIFWLRLRDWSFNEEQYIRMQECTRRAGVRSTRGDWGAGTQNSEGPLGCLGIQLQYCLKTRHIHCFMDKRAEYMIAI